MLKRLFTILSICIACNANAQLRMTNFCEAMDTVMEESNTGFKRIIAKMMASDMNYIMYASTIKIPGTIGYRIVFGMGKFYEGALFQSTDKSKLRPSYEQYMEQITKCLEPKGYKMTTQENFTAGLSDYKKLVWMVPPKEDAKAEDLPSHVTMEAMYNKDIGKFTLVMFIFQH